MKKLRKVVWKVALNNEIDKSCSEGGLKWWNQQKFYSRWLEMMKSTKVVLKVAWNDEIDRSCTQGGLKSWNDKSST